MEILIKIASAIGVVSIFILLIGLIIGSGILVAVGGGGLFFLILTAIISMLLIIIFDK